MINKTLKICLSILLVSISLYGCGKEEVIDTSKVENEIKEAVVTIKKDYRIDDENVQNIEKALKEKGKKVYLHTTDNVNIVLTIQTTGQIKDISINTIDGNLYSQVNYNIEEYYKKYGNNNGQKIENLTLNKDNALILKINELDVLPSYYLTFKDELNNTICYEVGYNGSDDYNGIDEIKINIEKENKNINEKVNAEKHDKFVKNTEMIFNNIFYEEDTDGYTVYYKIRKDKIEYQSNMEYYNDYNTVLDISYDSENEVVSIKSQNIDNEIYDYNIKIIDNNTITINDSKLKRLTNIDKAVKDLELIYGVDLETGATSNGLDAFLEVSEADIFECFNMHIIQEISQEEINKVNSQMTKEEAINLVTSEEGLKSKLQDKVIDIEDVTEYKFGNKIGYMVYAYYVDEEGMKYGAEELFVESETKKLGVFMKGLGYLMMYE